MPRFWNTTPASGANSPVPKDENSELMNEQVLRSRSITVM